MKDEVFEVIVLELDYYIIDRIRELRIRHMPYLSQLKLSQELELPESFVSKAENMKIRFKYNLRSINKAANLFQVPYAELFPKQLVKNDVVRMRLKKVTNKKRILTVNPDGTLDKAYEIISIKPLNEKELGLWNANKLEYLTIID